MSGFETKILALQPEYCQRDNRGYGERIELQSIDVTAQVTKRISGDRSYSWQFEFDFGVSDEGVVQLQSFKCKESDRGMDGHVGMTRFVRAQAAAESAVADWIRREDASGLALRSFDSIVENFSSRAETPGVGLRPETEGAE